ncbi:MAG: DUF3703 domain-containing protein [Sterolibacterium sp.]|jgi:hypothetical protein|nr:DUF3703 domain-containing protein [Sterolibacterium sp.]
MSPQLKATFATEMQQAKRYFRTGEIDSAFAHLERAHILGQRDVQRPMPIPADLRELLKTH